MGISFMFKVARSRPVRIPAHGQITGWIYRFYFAAIPANRQIAKETAKPHAVRLSTARFRVIVQLGGFVGNALGVRTQASIRKSSKWARQQGAGKRR